MVLRTFSSSHTLAAIALTVVVQALAGCAASDGLAESSRSVASGAEQDSQTTGPAAAATIGIKPPLLYQSQSAHFACAQLSNGAATCWGQNSNGQLGLGDTLDRGTSNPGQALPHVAMWPSSTTVATMGVAAAGACAVLTDTSLHCWGRNTYGDLGLGDTTDRGTTAASLGATPAIPLPVGVQLVQLSSGGSDHFCGVSQAGNVYCWGLNFQGQLGLGDTGNRGDGPNELGAALPAVNLGTGRTARSVTAGYFHTCAILDNSSIKCWGANNWGQLGMGDTTFRGQTPNSMGDNLPEVNLGVGRTVVALTAGFTHTCALLDNGQLKCWGANQVGQLGLGDTIWRGDTAAHLMGDGLPAVNLGTGATVVSAAASSYGTCAVLLGGSLKCWGALPDTEYQAGTVPDSMGSQMPAVIVGGGHRVESVVAGSNSACMGLDNGHVTCWGQNSDGELGLGDTMQRSYPTEAGYVPF